MSKRRKTTAAKRAALARKRRKQRRRRRAIVIVIEVILLIVLSITAFAVSKLTKMQKVSFNSQDIKINDSVLKKDGYTTVALFGTDSREEDLGKGTRTDTMMVATINNKTKEIRIASIYRDTLLEQTDGTFNKANSAYFTGGPKGAINMLNKNLDLDIEDYVTVDFKAMADVIDLIGGVKIKLTDAEANMLNEYLGETAQVAGKEAKEISGGGVHKLDGSQAVTYARLRKLEGGDYKRTERQRTVIKAIFAKASKMDITTINKIIDKVFPQISTSFDISEILGLATGVTQYKLGDNTGFPFEKTDGIMYEDCGDCVVALGLKENVEELHKFLYPDEETSTISATVQEISDNISYATGVTRPAELDQQDSGDGTSDTGSSTGDGTDTGSSTGDGTGTTDTTETSNTPVISSVNE